MWHMYDSAFICGVFIINLLQTRNEVEFEVWFKRYKTNVIYRL